MGYTVELTLDDTCLLAHTAYAQRSAGIGLLYIFYGCRLDIYIVAVIILKYSVRRISLISERHRSPLGKSLTRHPFAGAILREIGLDLRSFRDIVIEKLIYYFADI